MACCNYVSWWLHPQWHSPGCKGHCRWDSGIVLGVRLVFLLVRLLSVSPALFSFVFSALFLLFLLLCVSPPRLQPPYTRPPSSQGPPSIVHRQPAGVYLRGLPIRCSVDDVWRMCVWPGFSDSLRHQERLCNTMLRTMRGHTQVVAEIGYQFYTRLGLLEANFERRW